MIDLRAARHDPDAFRAALARRGAAEAFDELLAADERWRALVPRCRRAAREDEAEGQADARAAGGAARRQGGAAAREQELAAAEAARDEALARVPNPPHESVPDGKTEDDAVEVRRVGEPPKLTDPKEHTEIGRFDMERAARVSGARFGFIVGDAALVALALYRLALDRLTAEGFTPVLPPVLVREEAMYGTGFFPSDKSDYYAIPEDGLYLVGTSEVPLIAMHMDEILDELPLHYCAFSSCFRRESGAAGRDTRGCSACISSRRSRWSSTRHPTRHGTSTSGCSRSRSRSCRKSACRIASSTAPPAISRPRRRSATTSRRGSRRRSATAS